MRALRRRARFAAAGLVVLVATGAAWWLRGGGDAVADCALRYDRAARLECRAERGLDASDDMQDLRARVEATENPVERDLLLLRLVMDDPHRGRWACARVEDLRMGAWCRDVVGRSHLQPARGEALNATPRAR
ncbi:MAG: hypothetical protein FJ090_07460 [Deltaproteobacteria bacterium]|nr:hypothetical protein [Deltaproteobacteria bacterium]